MWSSITAIHNNPASAEWTLPPDLSLNIFNGCRGTLGTLTWIVASALAMSAIAWVGLVTVALNEAQLKKLLLPLVAFAAGSLRGGVLLHLLPEAVAARGQVSARFCLRSQDSRCFS